MLDAPGDHFMALIKFSSGIERLRHRVVVAFLTIMEQNGWRVTTIRRTNRGSTRKNMKRAGGYCITTPLGAFNISVSNSSTVSMSNISRQFEIAIHVASDTRPDDSKRFYISIARRFLSRTIFHSSRNASTIRGGKLLDENCRVSPHVFFDIPV